MKRRYDPIELEFFRHLLASVSATVPLVDIADDLSCTLLGRLMAVLTAPGTDVNLLSGLGDPIYSDGTDASAKSLGADETAYITLIATNSDEPVISRKHVTALIIQMKEAGMSDEERHDHVRRVSEGRVSSTSLLTESEATRLHTLLDSKEGASA